MVANNYRNIKFIINKYNKNNQGINFSLSSELNHSSIV